MFKSKTKTKTPADPLKYMKLHKPVLLKEAINVLNPKEGIIIDGTLGLGGHAEAILNNSKVSILGIDKDGEALELAKENLKKFKDRIIFKQGNFGNLKEITREYNYLGKVNGIILDLGVSSIQLDRANKGFSFKDRGPLDMRMDKNQTLTAGEIVNSWPKEKLYEIIRNYGEERLAGRISKAIFERRREKKFQATDELAEFIKNIVPKKYAHSKLHPATRTFQALRIAVNDELENLKKALKDSYEVLENQGKIAVISFHSLEDRIVKRFFKEMAKESYFKILTKKPIIPTEEEIMENVRARSAKLRAAIKN